MNVHKFFGSTTREALSKVRDALGADALILSNRQFEGGVEIMAVADGEVQALTYDNHASLGHKPPAQRPAPAPAAPARAAAQPAITPETIAAILHRRQPAAPGPGQNMRIPEFERVATPDYTATPASTRKPAAPQKPPARQPAPPRQVNPSAIAHAYHQGAEDDAEGGYTEDAYAEHAYAGSADYTSDYTDDAYDDQGSNGYGTPRPLATPADVAFTMPASPAFAPNQASPKPRRAAPAAAAATLPSDMPSLATPRDPAVAQMAQEIRYLRNLLEGQLSGFAWGELARKDPLKAELLRALLGSGFSPQLSRRLLDALPKGLDHERGLGWLKAALTLNLKTMEGGADLVERGGVHALVGPTGVGKTTTLAKLAARAVLKYGAERVALITTDSYRIGAHEQLKIYGRILNVPVHAVKDEAELELTLADLNRSHLVLIDTVGMSQRDRRIAEQIEFLCGHGSRIKRHLLLPATAQSVTLDDIVRAYQGAGMDGAILTKIDEALSLAPAVDCLIRHRLNLHYVTNGQKVPEDLHLANADYLVGAAFDHPATASSESSSPSPQSLTEQEWEVAVQWGEEQSLVKRGGRIG